MRVTRRWWPVLAVAALLAAAGMAASVTNLTFSRVEVTHAVESPEPNQSPPEAQVVRDQVARESSQFDLPAWILWLALGLGAAVVLVAAVRFFVKKGLPSGSRFQRRRLPKREPAPMKALASEVVAAVEAGLLELDESTSDPRPAVIACWVRLERAAQAAGTARHPGDTSTDLVLRLLATHDLSQDVLSGFADVYRLARYAARREVDESMRDQARAALTRLRGELNAGTVVAA